MATTVTGKARRGHGDDSIYFDGANNRWTGAVSLGYGPDGKRRRRKVTGRTRRDVQLKLRAVREEISDGLKTSASYTVKSAVDDWFSDCLDGKSEATVRLYEILIKPVTDAIGAIPLRDLTAHDVRAVLVKIAKSCSTRKVQITHNILIRAIKHAEANDHVRRNVAALAETPEGAKQGRPSKSMTPEQTVALLKAAEGSRLHAYVVLCLMTGIRTEEAGALRWDHLDLEAGTVSVWRSVRSSGDTKTPKSRRTLGLPQPAVDALRAHKVSQALARLEAGPLWQDHGPVFTSTVGTPLDRHNVLREFRKLTRAAGLGDDWVPRELRHSFVSMMSASGVAVEEIARLAGHSNTRTTETVYRKELRPVLTRGAEVMDQIFAGT
jgi:integrase